MAGGMGLRQHARGVRLGGGQEHTSASSVIRLTDLTQRQCLLAFKPIRQIKIDAVASSFYHAGTAARRSTGLGIVKRFCESCFDSDH